MPQYDAWMALGKELNATGRPIYYSSCPHRPMTSTFPGEGFAGVPKEWATDIAYSPPPEWSRAERHALANSILVEYTNSWYEPVGTYGHGHEWYAELAVWPPLPAVWFQGGTPHGPGVQNKYRPKHE